MCGICGVLRHGGDADPSALEAMNSALVHRGPDDQGSLVDGPAGLAARRLSIIDLEGGHQPIANEDATVHVVQNGEIYNHAELRRELEGRGHAFRTRCDTEVLVHLYEEHGPDFVERLRGMFAIALWDSRRRRLLLARDRFGIKPLYVHRRGGDLAFASELKALMRLPGFRREVDPRALESFLAFNSIPGPLSIFRDVDKLLPGHLLLADERGEEVREYARPGPLPPRGEDIGSLAEELRKRLRDSVRAHLIADVPVGVLLSGGVDSSALAALAAEESGERVRTFSIGFEEREFNELDLARLVAKRYDTEHHELIVRPDAAELLPRLAEVFDEPLADSSALPTFLVSELTSSNVKVALSGEGGDELFGGYYTYVADLMAPRLRPLAWLARPFVERLPSSSGKVSLDYKAKRFVRGARLPALERHHAWKEIFSPEARAGLGCASGYDPLEVYRRHFERTAGAEPLVRMQEMDLNVYLVDDLLVKTDRASMAHSLEARVPFLDTAVSDLALALPTSMKVRGFAKKRLLRKAIEPLVPKEIVGAKKQGFSIPAAAWLRGELEPFAREVLSAETLSRQGYFRPEVVSAMIDTHVSRREDLSRQLWGLLTFTLWHERWVEAPAGEPARAANPTL
jgi:asparagine synthase (glutamine-hydrolysing)